MKVIVNDSLIPKAQNAPLDYRDRINSEYGTKESIIAKILELGNPYEGQIVYDKSFDKYYVVNSVTVDEELNTHITIRDFQKPLEFATFDDITNLFN